MLGARCSPAPGGLLVAPLFLAEPSMGGALGLKAFVVSVIGGFGNLYGAVIAGLLLGVVEALAAGYVSSNFRDAFAFLLMVAFLFVRPQGPVRREAERARMSAVMPTARGPVAPARFVTARASSGCARAAGAATACCRESTCSSWSTSASSA